MTTPATDAILMAAGFSARFGGQNKLLAPFCGRPLALHTLLLACGTPRLGTVYWVTADPTVAALAEGTRAVPLHNAASRLGQRESIRLGVAASAAQGYLFFPCDQPLLDAATVNAVLDAAEPGAIVSPQWAGAPGGPTWFSAAYRDELLALAEGEHPRLLKRRHPARVRTVPAGSPLALADADTPEALARLEAQAQPAHNTKPAP